MDKIPSLIYNIVFIGNMNAGKSSLINSITDQKVSIVSEVPGTTTDEVSKRFELLDVGPVNIIDTAGYNDNSKLGIERKKKTTKAINHASLIVYVVAADTLTDDLSFYKKQTKQSLLVFNKIDLLTSHQIEKLKLLYPNALLVSSKDDSAKKILKELVKLLKNNEKNLLDGLKLDYNKIIHVIPIDSEAPKGRLILPQMQLIRECLDNNIVSIVIKETELTEYLNSDDKIGLIVTDSKIFKLVSDINNGRHPLTSYSILQANQKGDLDYFIESINNLKNLSDDARILIMESCSHNTSHEDIGSVMIPKILRDLISDNIMVDFKMAQDFYDNIESYDYIVHCGSCMMNHDVMQDRITKAKQLKIPMTNYGLMFAYKNGILNEATKIFNIVR